MNINNKISWIHLTSKMQQLVVAVLSVTFGISMYVFMNSFVGGINDTFTELSFTSLAHIRIYNDLPDSALSLLPKADRNTVQFVHNARPIQYTEGMKNATEIANTAASYPGVTAVACQLNQNVFFRNGVTKVSGNLSGVDVSNEEKVFHSSKYMLEGQLKDLDKRSDGIILGSGLAKSIYVNTGDNVSLLTSDGTSKTFKIVGIMETGLAATDKTKALVSIRTARQLFSKNSSYASDIQINTTDYNTADKLAGIMQKNISYKVESWKEGNSQLESSTMLRDILAYFVSFAILTVAGFGIYNIMNMTVNEKIREIAILKAMGFGGKDIVHIFLMQSLIIGIIGGIIGLMTGYLLSTLIGKLPYRIAYLTSLPIDFRPADYIMAFLFGLLVTTIAGYLPARKASRVDPVSILRG